VRAETKFRAGSTGVAKMRTTAGPRGVAKSGMQSRVVLTHSGRQYRSVVAWERLTSFMIVPGQPDRQAAKSCWLANRRVAAKEQRRSPKSQRTQASSETVAMTGFVGYRTSDLKSDRCYRFVEFVCSQTMRRLHRDVANRHVITTSIQPTTVEVRGCPADVATSGRRNCRNQVWFRDALASPQHHRHRARR
jgi:hypothetical protein